MIPVTNTILIISAIANKEALASLAFPEISINSSKKHDNHTYRCYNAKKSLSEPHQYQKNIPA